MAKKKNMVTVEYLDEQIAMLNAVLSDTTDYKAIRKARRDAMHKQRADNIISAEQEICELMKAVDKKIAKVLQRFHLNEFDVRIVKKQNDTSSCYLEMNSLSIQHKQHGRIIYTALHKDL